MSKYKSDKETKKEFVEFLRWYKLKLGNIKSSDEDLNDDVEKYFEEADIAAYNIQILRGVKNRNAKNELLIAIGSVILGIILSVILYNFIFMNS